VKKFYKVLVLFVFMVFLISCGGGGSGGSLEQNGSQNEENQSVPIESKFFTIDENSFKEGNFTKIECISKNAVVDLVPSQRAIEITNADVLQTGQNENIFIVKNSSVTVADKIGRAFFIDNQFKGMIIAVRQNGDELILTTQDAMYPTEVYDEFNLEFSNDEIVRSVKRAVKKVKGRYDYLNDKALKISIIQKSTSKSRSVEKEPVLRIDIPKGYRIPIEPRKLSCNIWNLSCNFTMQGELSHTMDLGKELKGGSLVFSSKGSYIELGLGAVLSVYYKKRFLKSPKYNFGLYNSAYFDANLIFTVSGSEQKDWEQVINLIGGLDIEIPTPVSAAVKLSVLLKPEIVVGIHGKIKGDVVLHSRSVRGGETRFRFSNTKGGFESNGKKISYKPVPLNQKDIDMDIEAVANAYVFPEIGLYPRVAFLRVIKPLSFGVIRSGIMLDNHIEGIIHKDFVLDASDNDKITADVSSSIYALIQYKMNVLLGKKTLYKSKKFLNLYKSNSITLFKWQMYYLNDPVINIQKENEDYLVSFDIDDKEKNSISYYYTINVSEDIPAKDIAKKAALWDKNPIRISTTSTLKVRAVKYGEKTGASISKQSIKKIEIATPVLKAPTVTPPNLTEFEDTLSVEFHQEEGYPVYYKMNGGKSILYKSPVMIKDTTEFEVYAAIQKEGKWYTSDVVNVKYIKKEIPPIEINPPKSSVPSGSTFHDNLKITLSQDQKAEIYYSINGGDYQKYEKELILNESTFINTYAQYKSDDKKISKHKYYFYTKYEGFDNPKCPYEIDQKSCPEGFVYSESSPTPDSKYKICTDPTGYPYYLYSNFVDMNSTDHFKFKTYVNKIFQNDDGTYTILPVCEKLWIHFEMPPNKTIYVPKKENGSWRVFYLFTARWLNIGLDNSEYKEDRYQIKENKDKSWSEFVIHSLSYYYDGHRKNEKFFVIKQKKDGSWIRLPYPVFEVSWNHDGTEKLKKVYEYIYNESTDSWDEYEDGFVK